MKPQEKIRNENAECQMCNEQHKLFYFHSQRKEPVSGLLSQLANVTPVTLSESLFLITLPGRGVTGSYPSDSTVGELFPSAYFLGNIINGLPECTPTLTCCRASDDYFHKLPCGHFKINPSLELNIRKYKEIYYVCHILLCFQQSQQ